MAPSSTCVSATVAYSKRSENLQHNTIDALTRISLFDDAGEPLGPVSGGGSSGTGSGEGSGSGSPIPKNSQAKHEVSMSKARLPVRIASLVPTAVLASCMLEGSTQVYVAAHPVRPGGGLQQHSEYEPPEVTITPQLPYPDGPTVAAVTKETGFLLQQQSTEPGVYTNTESNSFPVTYSTAMVTSGLDSGLQRHPGDDPLTIEMMALEVPYGTAFATMPRETRLQTRAESSLFRPIADQTTLVSLIHKTGTPPESPGPPPNSPSSRPSISDHILSFFPLVSGFFLITLIWNLYIRAGRDRGGAKQIDGKSVGTMELERLLSKAKGKVRASSSGAWLSAANKGPAPVLADGGVDGFKWKQ
ncbi:uncharacterized protein Z518_01020 [Rhinocladiella mackenziei CBS 650.93]|uniref:Rhinocladiella mackenziei CBS 650.93 unplaced genomic scaffold supercont1.1, whole genome shotgun sequence n=1 Tax=Rhinocladiella mackenziei CBS 650.93 TaxID=1442369 RepID=A0A0D2IV31_9EURO|nr:uncharacterized protein Z518_01020 [Rhinocladiella mackenziei CBS 650.93]KIX09939.1 hypothetical protein Z518_01020 [Rhinocladiella mackenziei CBS 650.93]